MNNSFKKEFVNLINKHSEKYKLKESEFGHFYVDPMPSEKELSLFYQDRYFNNSNQIASKGMDIGSSNPKERFHYDRQYNEISSFLKNNFNNKNIKILDAGCGVGQLLEYLYNDGFYDLYGTEYDSSLNNKNIKMFNGDFLDFQTDEKFDFISFSSVLEHVIDPVAFVQKAYNMLTDGGYLRIQVPNDLSYTQYMSIKNEVNPNFYFFLPPEHLHYFDFDSMEKMLKSNNFNVVKKLSQWPMELFILMGIDYGKDPLKGKDCHNYRINFEYNVGEEFLLEYYSKLAEVGLGRAVIVYSKKNDN